jgi:hypothetical protein
MNILMRGDCTSRRALFYNKDLFPADAKVIQDQKAPFILFNEHLNGVPSSKDAVLQHVDVDRMPPILQSYFLGQFERSLFDQNSAGLLVMDSYADMNFELYEPKSGGAKFWVHRGYVRDMAAFNQTFKYLGRRTLQQSVDDAVEFIAHVRKRYGPIPVLFLNQQVEFYPKLHERLEYYDLGEQVARRVDGCEYGGFLGKDELDLADLGSCGPGLTLHYTGDTYRKMLERVGFIRQGLGATVPEAVTPVLDGAPVAPSDAPAEESPLSISLLPAQGPLPYDRNNMFQKFRHYFIISDADVYEPKFLPAVIQIDEVRDYETWVKATKKAVGDNAFRNERKANQRGYQVLQFDRRTFIPDIHAINHSMPVRSGLEMKTAYTKSIEELGGYPTQLHAPMLPASPEYWAMSFGAFLSEPGYQQGSVVTDKRLVGYISVRRIGELILYPQLLGHGDHLNDGIMAQIHFHVLRWLIDPSCEYSRGAKVLMYTAANVVNEGLRTWKKRAGFKGRKINLSSY